jgi:hypothetical protein
MVGFFAFGEVFCLLAGFFLCACGVGLCLIYLPARRLFVCGVGLSLYSYWSISVAPVRGGTYFLCRRKER